MIQVQKYSVYNKRGSVCYLTEIADRSFSVSIEDVRKTLLGEVCNDSRIDQSAEITLFMQYKTR